MYMFIFIYTELRARFYCNSVIDVYMLMHSSRVQQNLQQISLPVAW